MKKIKKVFQNRADDIEADKKESINNENEETPKEVEPLVGQGEPEKLSVLLTKHKALNDIKRLEFLTPKKSTEKIEDPFLKYRKNDISIHMFEDSNVGKDEVMISLDYPDSSFVSDDFAGNSSTISDEISTAILDSTSSGIGSESPISSEMESEKQNIMLKLRDNNSNCKGKAFLKLRNSKSMKKVSPSKLKHGLKRTQNRRRQLKIFLPKI
jgi:hypothetical protein